MCVCVSLSRRQMSAGLMQVKDVGCTPIFRMFHATFPSSCYSPIPGRTIIRHDSSLIYVCASCHLDRNFTVCLLCAWG